MKNTVFILILMAFFSCKTEKEEAGGSQTSGDTLAQTEEIDFKVLESKFINNSLWIPFQSDLDEFSEIRYNELKAVILEQNIPEIQEAVQTGDLSYEELALFYLYRIRKYDRRNELSLNSVISLNPKLLPEAREKDKALQLGEKNHPIYGIPVLLKDNINTENMNTTAGSVALRENQTDDAFIVEKLKENGALILGKANLSEWAYFFCGDCPSGYSAIGGQTLNPYGRKIFDTGGSSSGSAVAVAANLAPVAVGSETSGSILSPSSQNTVVGLKPTVGVLSRSGIVPISTTLDTPGPITKSVVDNAILLSAMKGKDPQDSDFEEHQEIFRDYYSSLEKVSVEGKRFGAIKSLMEDSLYVRAVNDLKKSGAEVIVFETEEIELPDFLRLLSLDMKKDLPDYFNKYSGNLPFKSIEDVVVFNIEDSVSRMPYGQVLFEGIAQDTASHEELETIKDSLRKNGRQYFDIPMEEHKLDAVLSVNNQHAAFAAVAHYPAITVPMGYDQKAPKGLTIITRPYQEEELLRWALVYEKNTNHRIPPENYIE